MSNKDILSDIISSALDDDETSSQQSVGSLPGQNLDNAVLQQKLDRMKNAAQRSGVRPPSSHGMVQSQRPLSSRGSRPAFDLLTSPSTTTTTTTTALEPMFKAVQSPKETKDFSLDSSTKWSMQDFEDNEMVVSPTNSISTPTNVPTTPNSATSVNALFPHKQSQNDNTASDSDMWSQGTLDAPDKKSPVLDIPDRKLFCIKYVFSFVWSNI